MCERPESIKGKQEAAWKMISYMLKHGEEYLTEVNKSCSDTRPF
jgi:hypothetical protein